jgi:DNA repair exonuclease SbcCD nuclease subunit
MRVCLLGDTHFGIRNDSKSFHAFYEKFYNETFFPELEKRNVRTIIQLGDLFDRRKYINFLSLTESRRYFFDQCAERGITVHALIGNHDIFWRESLEVNSPDLLLRDYHNIRLWQKPGTLELDGIKIDMIPWICKDNEQEIFDFVKNSNSPLCMGHFELEGFLFMRGIKSHEGFDYKFLNNYTHVFSGHYHTFSTQDNITYIGTPYELFWNDYKDQKQFAILDTETLKVDYVKNPHRMFFKVNYDDSTLKIEELKNIDFSRYANAYVKVVVLNKQNPYIFDKMMDEIYKVGPIDVNIVEDFTTLEEESEDGDIIDQAQDTMTILSSFIDGQSLNISDTNKLKTLMRELYIESLSRENVE